MGLLSKITNFFLRFYNLKIKATIINHEKFLGNQKNSADIYELGGDGFFYSPLNISFDHMDRLMLLNFERDPLFNGIELQIICENGKEYPIIILYKTDESQDVYYTSSKLMENQKENPKRILSKPAFHVLRDIDFQFQVDSTGLDAYLSMIEKQGHHIEFKIRENNPNRVFAAMLAPAGAGTLAPQFFPFIFLDNFGIISKNSSEMYVKIDGTIRKPSEYPVKVEGKHRYLARFSLEPILGYWNNTYEGPLQPIKGSSNLEITDNNLEYYLENNEGHFEIKKIAKEDQFGHKLFFEFSPAIPDLVALEPNIQLKGRFSSGINEKAGIVAGTYKISRKGETITFSINPSKGWQPMPGESWVSSYIWTANIRINKSKITAKTGWERTDVTTSKEFLERTSKK